MPDCLASLEARRAGILRAIGGLGDLRAGSITSTGGRCGNPGCHCHRPGDPGHGPYYRLTRKVKGKTVTETFATEVERRKAQGEVDGGGQRTDLPVAAGAAELVAGGKRRRPRSGDKP